LLATVVSIALNHIVYKKRRSLF